VGERDFARTRDDSAADQPRIGEGVVRRAVGPISDQARTGIEYASDAVDLCRLQRFLERKGRQDCRHTFGKHGLA